MQIDKSKVLALITARGGSKGLPRKNVLQVAGRPLIAWTIEAALKSNIVDRVVLSSDDNEIIETAKSWGCSVPFRRPAHLANDTASSMQVVLHALEQLPGFDYVILLQPTSPLRTASDIDAAFHELKSTGRLVVYRFVKQINLHTGCIIFHQKKNLITYCNRQVEPPAGKTCQQFMY